jgi:hypothetical protein
MRCQSYWYEKYVNKQRLAFDPSYQRDDALAIGVAVHEALENGYRQNNWHVSEETLVDLNLTREALLEVNSMIEAYRMQYPSGPVEFPWHGLESPLDKAINSKITMTAKVDGWFQVTEPITVSAGIGDIYLAPGYYTFETKTKKPGYDRGLYIAEWQAAMQASFQLITLKANAERLGINPDEVKGVLVNVIERPKVYEPKRTCQSCGKLIEVKSYIPQGKGYRCPLCDHFNVFTGKIPAARVESPFMYRFLIERSQEQLDWHQNIIHMTAMTMNSMIDTDDEFTLLQPTENHTQCINWNKKCEYYEPHNNIIPASAVGWPRFETFNPTAYLEKYNATN